MSQIRSDGKYFLVGIGKYYFIQSIFGESPVENLQLINSFVTPDRFLPDGN